MLREVQTKFFHFRQNNSFGRWVEDSVAGIGVNVIIEAVDAEDANRRAEEIGLYFDDGRDCPCCGSRWSSQWSGEKGDDKPSEYDTEISDENAEKLAVPEYPYHNTKNRGYIHYFDGTKKAYNFTKKAYNFVKEEKK